MIRAGGPGVDICFVIWPPLSNLLRCWADGDKLVSLKGRAKPQGASSLYRRRPHETEYFNGKP